MKKAGFCIIFFTASLIKVAGQQNVPLNNNLSNKEIQERYLQKKMATAVYNTSNAIFAVSPEQDCLAAIPLCDSAYTQTNAYIGTGNIPNEIDPNSSCLLSGEKNDVWYTFTVQVSGILNFSITPLNVNDDYDWALYNLTGHVCADIFTTPSLEVRCNYAPNLGCGGITGPNNDTTGTCGGQNESAVMVLAGETYVINVSNFSTTQFGYTIDFSESTAVIYDNVPPQPTVTGMNCTDSIFTIAYPTELIDCSTIAADGSDFQVLDLSGNFFPVLAAAGSGCGVSQPYTSQVIITLNAANVVYPGFYLLVKTGSDGNTFADKCGNFAGLTGSTDTVAFVNVLNNILLEIGSDTAVCAADAKPLLNAQNNGAVFSWSYNQSVTGINTPTLQTTYPGTYTVTVTYGQGCTATDSMQLGFLPSFPFNLGNDTSVCQGNPLPVLYTGISNAANYQWYVNDTLLPGASADSLVTTQPGVYVAAVDSGTASCPGVDTVVVSMEMPAIFDLGSDLVFCEGDSILVKAGIIGSGFSYQWSFNNNQLPEYADSVYVKEVGTYYLEVTTVTECSSVDSVKTTLYQRAGAVKVYCPQNNGTSNTYNWDPAPNATGYLVSLDGVSGWTTPSSGPQGNSHTTPLSVQTIYVQAQSTSICPPGPVSESLPCDVVISNILTPNQDGKNDFFFIKNLDQFPGTSVKIFNRWGLAIFKSTDYRNDWDGDQVAEGVYFYEVIIPGNITRTGTLTILN